LKQDILLKLDYFWVFPLLNWVVGVTIFILSPPPLAAVFDACCWITYLLLDLT